MEATVVPAAPAPQEEKKTVQVFLYAVVCAVGLLANAILLVAFLRRRTLLKKPLNVCILILCIVDIEALFTIPFVADFTAAGTWTFGKTLCKMFLTDLMFAVHGSMLMVIVLASTMIHFMRKMPNKDTGSPQITLIICIGVCLLALALALPDGILSDGGAIGDKYYCFIGWNQYYGAGKMYEFTLQIASNLAILITLIVMIVYFCLRWDLLKISNGDGKAAVMVLVILIIEMILSLFFFFTISVGTRLAGYSAILAKFTVAAYALSSYAPCVIRPLLYACFCPPIRNSMKHVITFGRLRDDSENGEELPLLTEPTVQ